MKRLRWLASLGWVAVPTAGCGAPPSTSTSSETGSTSGSSSDTGTSLQTCPCDGPGSEEEYCLAAGTCVETPDGPRTIESLRIGDRIHSVDLGERRRVVATVVAVRSAERECLALWIDEAVQVLATPEHPIYRPSRQAYVPAGDLVTGHGKDVLRVDGAAFIEHAVTKTEAYAGIHRVYDITVDSEHHNFIAEGIVVHNKQPDDTGTTGGSFIDPETTSGSFIDPGTETGTGSTGSTDGGETSACEPITADASGIGATCDSDADCPQAYTCMEFVGINVVERCAILCTTDCECPDGHTCEMHADKQKQWLECTPER